MFSVHSFNLYKCIHEMDPQIVVEKRICRSSTCCFLMLDLKKNTYSNWCIIVSCPSMIFYAFPPKKLNTYQKIKNGTHHFKRFFPRRNQPANQLNSTQLTTQNLGITQPINMGEFLQGTRTNPNGGLVRSQASVWGGGPKVPPIQ